jgi:hypothetical protein
MSTRLVCSSVFRKVKRAVFSVEVPIDKNELYLKKLVHEEGLDTTKVTVLPKDLVLWKVLHIPSPALIMSRTAS